MDGEVAAVTGGLGTEDFETPRSDKLPGASGSAGGDLIDANDVLKALKQFVEDNKQAPK